MTGFQIILRATHCLDLAVKQIIMTYVLVVVANLIVDITGNLDEIISLA